MATIASVHNNPYFNHHKYTILGNVKEKCVKKYD